MKIPKDWAVLLNKKIIYRNLLNIGSSYLLLFPLLLIAISSLSFSQNTWTSKANFGGGIRSDAVAFTIGTKGYVGSGYNGTIVTKDIWEYDPIANTWSQKADITGVARQGAIGLTLNSKGYVGLGYDGGSTYLQDWYEYDATLNSWTTKTSFTGVGRAGSAYVEINNIAYVGLGADATRRTDWYAYNPTTNSWTQKTSFGGSARRYTSHFAVSSKAYVVTGDDGTVKQDTWEYDPITNVWTQKVNFGGSARQLAKGFAIGNKGYVTCGTTGTAQNDLWEYDASLNTWTAKTNFSGSARYFLEAFVINNLAYVGIGNNHTPTYYSDFYQYTPGTTPSVNTNIISSITATTATSGGTISTDGNYAITAKGVVWSTSPNPTVALATKTNDGTGTGSFTSSITGLSAGTQYYYRAYATNSQGTSYGTEYTFTTTNTTPNSWTRHSDFVSGRMTMVGFSIGTKGYVGTGWNGSTRFKDLWEYDPATCQWAQKADLGGVARDEAVGFSIGTKGYVGTGDNGTSKLNDFWEYDPTPNTWAQKANYGGGIVGQATGISINGKGYLGTGYDGSSLKNNWYEYNVTNNTWTQKTNFGGGARASVASFVINNKGYIGTGDPAGADKKDLWEYNPESDVWTQKTDLPATERYGARGFAINNKGYIGLGWTGSNQNDLYEYDPTLNTWTQKNDLPFSGAFRNRSSGLGLANSTKGFIIGGFDCSTGRTYTEIIEYNPTNDSWVQRANFHDRISSKPAGFVVDENLYVYATGNCVSNLDNSFFCYNTTTNSWSNKASFPGTDEKAGIGFAIGKKGYLGTGREQSLAVSNKMYEYDVTSDIWKQISNVPTAGTEHANGISLGNKAYFGLGASIGTSWSEYTPSTIPSFYITTAISSITSSGGVVSAVTDANFNGCTTNSITSKGIIIGNSSSFTLSNASFTFTNGSGNTGFSSTLTGLSPATTYYARAFSTTAVGSNYGNAVSFTTLAGAPTVTTTAITSIATTSASSGGNVTSDGGAAVTGRGLVWSSSSTNPNISNYDGISSNSTGTGTFTQSLNALCPGTTYYVRAYATNSAGTVYSDEVVIKTKYSVINDGNQDGILDTQQDHVHTFQDISGTKTITLVDLNNNLISEVSSSISSESNFYYPFGLMNFKIHASQTELKIYFHGTSNLSSYIYRKLYSDNKYRKYDYAVFGSEIIGGNTVATLTLTLVDGGIGDSDGIVNGVITDPGGPAIAIVDTNIPTLSEWTRIALISLILILGVWKIRMYV